MSATFGLKISPSDFGPRGVLSVDPETTGVGNIVIRAGEANESGPRGWHQVAHIVLTRTEALELIEALAGLLKEEK